MSKKLRLVEINTTSESDNNFFLITDLSDEQIVNELQPIVNEERLEGVFYDNEMLVDSLKKEFPNFTIIFYPMDEADFLTI